MTFNIPREAAQRLRQLAEEGSQALSALGILSVQVQGDQVITIISFFKKILNHLISSFNKLRMHNADL